MSYVRFVPGFSRHPKRLKCGPISSWLWACSVDYCMQHLTDGFLMAEAVPTLCPNITGSALKRAVDNLLAVRSWEQTEGGYFVHDYLGHNQSKADVEADREASRKRYNAWLNKRRANGVANALATDAQRRSNGVPNAVPNVTHGLSIGLMLEPTTSKEPVTHVTRSDRTSGEQTQDLERKKQAALAVLTQAFPGLKIPHAD